MRVRAEDDLMDVSGLEIMVLLPENCRLGLANKLAKPPDSLHGSEKSDGPN